jgi:hypothetical protein
VPADNGNGLVGYHPSLEVAEKQGIEITWDIVQRLKVLFLGENIIAAIR